jgi:N-acetylglucosaminyldiphosphoundecaprenol N-acetyl-beta-D-mannosaminyltransferase
MSAPSPTCEILGSRISRLDCAEVVEELCRRASRGEGGYVCVSNVHTVVEGLGDDRFRSVTNGAALATADGMPLVWVSPWLGSPIHGRASGPDVLAKLLESNEGRALPHYFVGSTPAVVEALKANLTARYPGLRIAGMEPGPLYGVEELRSGAAAGSAEHKNLMDRIRGSGAKLVWVGLGAPKQEYWMSLAAPALPGTTLVGVGAAFDFLAGKKPRAPLWMQKNGLEWLHRWSTEPRRLTGRYVSTNARFIVAVARQLLTGGR